jgi:hypothetical protein
MRRWIQDLHLYLGLFCMPYVVLFGASAFLLVNGLQLSTSTREVRRVAALRGDDVMEDALRVQHQLGLRGVLYAESVSRTEGGGLLMRFQRPGRIYEARVAADGSAEVATENATLFGVIAGLHGSTIRWGGWWADAWALYTELAVWVLGFSIASGSWLALSRMGGRILALAALGLGTVISLAIVSVVW